MGFIVASNYTDPLAYTDEILKPCFNEIKIEQKGNIIEVYSTSGGTSKLLTLTDLQQQTANKIMALENRLITLSEHKHGQSFDSQVKNIKIQLDSAKAVRKFLRDEVSEDKSGVKSKIKSAWRGVRNTDRDFKINREQWDEIEPSLNDALGDEIQVAALPLVGSKVAGFTKINLKASGKDVNFSELKFLIAKRIDRLSRLLQTMGIFNAERMRQLDKLQKTTYLASKLDDVESGEVQENISLSQKISKFFGDEKKIVVEKNEWKNLKDLVIKSFAGKNLYIDKHQKGEKFFIKIKLDGIYIGLSDLRRLVLKTRDELRSAKEHTASEESQMMTLDLLLEKIEGKVEYQSGIQKFFSSKDHSTSTLRVAASTSDWAVNSSGYTKLSDTRLSFKAKDMTKEDFSSFKQSLALAFKGEEEISVLVSGTQKDFRSSSQSAEIEASWLKRQANSGRVSFEVGQHGQAISMRSLIMKVKDRIGALKEKLYLQSEGTPLHENVELQKQIQAAHLLLAKLDGVTEYLNTSQEVFLAGTKVICSLGSVFTVLFTAARESWRNRKTRKSVEKEFNLKGASKADKVAAKRAISKGSELRKALTSNERSFIKELQSLSTVSPNELLMIKASLRNQNRVLKDALKGGKLREVEFIIGEKLFKNVSAGVLNAFSGLSYATVEQREHIITSLFKQCNDGQSMAHIIHFLFANGNIDLATKLISDYLVQPQIGNDVIEKRKLDNARLLAAQIGTPELLEKAFGVLPNDTQKLISEKVQPYLFLGNAHGKSLLGFACEGINPKFVMAIDKAIRKDYHDRNETEIKALEDFSLTMRTLPKNSKSKQNCKAELDKFIAQHPNLQYLEKYILHPKKIQKALKRELQNREISPMHATDAHGMSPLRLMNPGLAIEMDKLLGKELKANGKLKEGEVVSCFTNAAEHYNVYKSRQNKFLSQGVLLGKLIACTGLVAITPVLPTGLPTVVTFLMNEALFQVPVLGGIAVAAAGSWYQNRGFVNRIKAKLQGKFQSLTQYEEEYPIHYKKDGKPKSVKIEKNLKMKLFVAGTSSVKTAISHGANAAVATARSILRSDINKMLVRNHQNLLTALNRHDARKALDFLKTGSPFLPKNDQGVWADDLIDAFAEVMYFPDDTEEQILEELFNSITSTEQLEGLVDVQLAKGHHGIQMATNLLEKHAAEWQQPESKFTLAQYETALLVCAKIGNMDLYKKFLQIEKGQLEFLAAGRWNKAGGEKISLLHAAMLGNLAGSDTKSAALGRKIYENMVDANRFLQEADVFAERKGNVSPLEIERQGKKIQDLVSNGSRAAALDEEFGLDSSVGFCLLRDLSQNKVNQADVNKVALGLPTNLVVGSQIGMAAQEIANFGAVAILTATHGNVLAAFAFRIASVFWIEGIAYAVTCLVRVGMGEGIASARQSAENIVRGYDNEIIQLGRTQQEVEKALTNRRNRIEIHRLVRQIIIDSLKEGFSALKAAKPDDLDLHAKLAKIENTIDFITQGKYYGNRAFKEVGEVLVEAEFTPDEADVIGGLCFEKLKSVGVCVELARAVQPLILP